MLTEYFGAITTGKLKRLRFVGLWLLLMIVYLCFALLIGVSIGAAEHLIGGDLATAQKILVEKFALPAALGVIAAAFVFLFAILNLIAKRARDVGLPGWITAIVIAGLSGSASQLMGATTSGGIGGILLIILTLLPSGMIKR